jgi:hypothetical protein
MTTSPKSSPLLKAASLWAKSSVKGGQYLTRRLGAMKILILENRDRQNDDDPSHHLLFTEAPDRRQGTQDCVDGQRGAGSPPNGPEATTSAAQRLSEPWAAGCQPSGAARRQRRAGMGPVMRPEEQLHRAVVQLLMLYANRGLLVFVHVPNGGRRTRAEAGVLKAMGTTPGVSDLLIWLPGGGHFQIELKAGNGRLSAHQATWISRMNDMGIAVHVIGRWMGWKRCYGRKACRRSGC